MYEQNMPPIKEERKPLKNPFTLYQTVILTIGIGTMLYLVFVAMPEVTKCADIQRTFESGDVAKAFGDYAEASGWTKDPQFQGTMFPGDFPQ